MSQQLQQNQTAHPLCFLLVSSTDHVSPVTGLGSSVTVLLSKDGAAFASPAGAISEIGDGWYQVAGNATDANTLGSLMLHASGTGSDPSDKEYLVLAYNPYSGSNLGLSALPTASPAAAGGIPTVGLGSGQISPASGTFTGVGLAATQTGVTIPTVTTLTNAVVASSVTGSVGSVTGNVGGSVASVTGSVGSVTGAVGSISGITFPSNFGTFSIDSSGRVTLIPGDVAPTTSAIAAAILATPAHLLATDSSGDVTYNNAAPPSAATISAAVAAAVPTDTTIQADIVTSLTGQGYTSARAGYLDALNGLVATIWSYATRTLSAFGFTPTLASTQNFNNTGQTTNQPVGGVTVTTNNDKTGYSLATGDTTAATIANLTTGSGGAQQFTTEALALAPAGGGGSALTAQDVWTYTTRALTIPAPQVAAPQMQSAPVYYMLQGDTRGIFQANLVDQYGNAVDLTGCTVEFVMSPQLGVPSIASGTASVTNATSGGVQYAVGPTDSTTPGRYVAYWLVVYADGSKQELPTFAPIVVVVNNSIPV